MECAPWPIDIGSCCETVSLPPDDPKVLSVIAQVTVMMSRWSGFAYGGCATVRPLDPCGTCRSGCCASGDCIVLHGTSSVTEVRVDGVAVDPSEYNYDAGRGILCAVPPMTWPTADPRYEAVGTLEVDTVIGAAPDDWTLAVAAELACELIKSCTGKGKCRLPEKATSITSLGVTVTLTEEELKYALPSVTAWVNTINPQKATQPARIYSREADRQRVMGARQRNRLVRPWR